MNLVDELLSAGTSAFVADHRANTALHLAAAAGHEHICRTLLDKGADLHLPNRNGKPAWLLAQENKQRAVHRLFFPHPSDAEFTKVKCTATERLRAAHDGDVQTLGRTQDSGDSGDITALMVACRAKQRIVVEKLLEWEGQLLNQRSADGGCTALYLAAEEGDEGIVGLLLKHHADVTLADSSGTTVLHVAAEGGHEQVALELLKAGADPNKAKDDGYTALVLSCFSGHERCLRALLKNGAAVNSQSKDGMTSLMWASFNGHEQIAQLLINAGADKSVKCGFGTAISLAHENGHKALCNLLDVDNRRSGSGFLSSLFSFS